MLVLILVFASYGSSFHVSQFINHNEIGTRYFMPRLKHENLIIYISELLEQNCCVVIFLFLLSPGRSPSNLSTGTWFFSIFECIFISYRFCDFVSCCVCYVSLDLSGAVSVQCLTSILPFSWLLSHHHGSKNRFSNISRMPGKSRTLLELSNFKDTK